MALNLYPWARQTTAPARDLVRQIIRTSPTPLSTKAIFKEAIDKHAPTSRPRPTSELSKLPGPLPPNPDHPVRSIAYLKHVVLPDLVQRKEVRMVHKQRTLTQEEIDLRLASMTKAQRAQATARPSSNVVDMWVWQAREPSAQSVAPVKEEAPVFGAEVGVGEDWGHLNRRRRRTREEKIARDVDWMRKLARARADSEPSVE